MFLLNWTTFKYCSHENVYDPRNLIYVKNLTRTFSSNSTNSNSTSNYSSKNLDDIILKNKCFSTENIKDCMGFKGKCVTTYDSFYALTGIFLGCGILWFIFVRKTIRELNNSASEKWKLK